MRLNRVRILAGLAHAPCPQFLGRGMSDFIHWGMRARYLKPGAGQPSTVEITAVGRDALRRSVAEYERHGWMGHVGMSKEKLGGKK